MSDKWHTTITECESFTFKSKFLDNTSPEGIINTQITVPLIFFRNFSRPLEISLMNCESNLILPWSGKYVILEENRARTSAKTYVLL